MDLFLALYPALMFQRMGFGLKKKIVLSVMLSVYTLFVSRSHNHGTLSFLNVLLQTVLLTLPCLQRPRRTVIMSHSIDTI